jgi:hypothetical protein
MRIENKKEYYDKIRPYLFGLYTCDSVASLDLGRLCDFIQFIDYNVDNNQMKKANSRLQEMLNFLLIIKLSR